jgi:hypothetical protein
MLLQTKQFLKENINYFVKIAIMAFLLGLSGFGSFGLLIENND